MAYCKKLRLGNLLKFFLNTALLTSLVLQAYIGGCFIVFGYLSLPSEWFERVIKREYLPEIILKINELKLFPGGNLALTGVDVKAANIKQSLLVADLVVVSLDWPNLSEQPKVKDLLISKGTVFIPSVYSPDGYQKPLLERMTLRISLGEVVGKMNQFVALHEDIRLRGTFETPTHIDSDKSYDLSQKLKVFYTQAANIIQQKEQINYFESPTITFSSRTINHEKKEIDLHISSRDLRHPEIFAKDIELLGSLELTGLEPTLIKTARLNAKHLEVPSYGLMTDNLLVEFDPKQLKILRAGYWPYIRVAAKNLAFGQFISNAPILEIDFGEYPEVAFFGITGSLDGAAALSGHINAQTRSGKLRARGSLDLAGLAPTKLRSRIPEIIFKTPPYYQVELDINPDFTLGQANIKANLSNLQVDGITFDHIAANASFQDGIYELEDLHIRRKGQKLNIDFNFDSRSYDYRTFLIGSIKPDDYNTLLPQWWASIFRDFDFNHEDTILSDFIIYGNARSRLADLYYGRARANNIRYKDVIFDESDLIVRGRNGYTELKGLKVACGHGWASGDIAFVSKPDKIRAPVSVRLDMQAKLSLEDVTKLSPENIAPIISNFKTNEPTLFCLKGTIFNKKYPEHTDKNFFNLSADCTRAITFKKIPLNRLSFDLYGRPHATYVRDLKLIYADGEGTGEIDIPKEAAQENTLRYRFSLRNADQKKALQGLSEFDDIETSFDVLIDDNRKNLSSGRLDMSLHGEGPLKDPMKHAGYGSFVINNDQLGSIQLLGPLSKILQKTPLNFTTFNLNHMHGEFRYKNEDVHFDPLLLEGELTRIQSTGGLSLSDLSLDMRVNVSLFANTNLIQSRLKNITNVITNTLPKPLIFELTGTLSDQKLRSLYDPRNLIPGL